jgi:hypothetical protein
MEMNETFAKQGHTITDDGGCTLRIIHGCEMDI